MTDPQVKIVLKVDWDGVDIEVIVQGTVTDGVAEAASKVMAVLNPSWCGPK